MAVETFDISDNDVQVTVGVIGDANSGKSTLLNALLAECILPTAATSCTSILTHITISGEAAPILRTDHREVSGASQVKKEISRLNEAVRTGPGSGRVADVAVSSAPRGSLAALGDKSMKLIDVPGHNESMNFAVRDCFRVVSRLSDVLMVILKYDAINTESTRNLLDLLEENAMHVLAPSSEESPKLVFVISQCDAVWTGLDDDERDGADLVQEIKASFRRFLKKNWGKKFPSTQTAPILAVTALNVLERQGELLDWSLLEEFLAKTHASRCALRSEAKLVRAQSIVQSFHSKLTDLADTYPQRAQSVIREKVQAHLDVDESNRTFWKNVAICTAGTALTVGGGWMAVAGWGARAAAVASYTAASSSWFASSAAVASAASAVTAAEVAVLSGSVVGVAGSAMAVVSGVSAAGAAEANTKVQFNASYEDIMDGKPYEDTLTNQEKVLYVGEFIGTKPHGKGRAFWPNRAQSEAMIGEFEEGQFVKGFLLDELEVVVGHFQVIEGKVEVMGWQPEDQALEPCSLCSDAASMASLKKALAPCNHGSICVSCAESLLREPTPECPVCHAKVNKIIRIA